MTGSPALSERTRGRSRRLIPWRLALAAVLISALLVLADGEKVLAFLGSVDLRLAAVAISIAAVDRMVMALKWYPLLRTHVRSVSLPYVIRSYWAASFAGKFLPMSVGADVVRTMAVGRAGGDMPAVGASIVMERLLGMAASGLIALAAIGVGTRAGVDPAFLLPWTIGAAALSMMLIVIPLHVRLGTRSSLRSRYARFLPDAAWLRRFRSAYVMYRARGPLLVGVGIASLLEQGFPILVLWVLSVAIGSSIQLYMLLFAVPLTLLVARLPFSTWALGIAEGALMFLLGLFGVPAAEALALGLGGRAAELVAVLPGALWWRELLRPREDGTFRLRPSASPTAPVEP